MKKNLINPCSGCYRREATEDNGRCASCNKFENPCTRCGRHEAHIVSKFNSLTQQYDTIKYGRCEGCLDYAAKWQRKKTEKARATGQCIVCKAPSRLSRCEYHAKIKSNKNYAA